MAYFVTGERHYKNIARLGRRASYEYVVWQFI
jgi:hypothetical protein